MRALPQLRRLSLRQPVHALAYVNLNRGNGGVVLDLSENGVALHAVKPLARSREPVRMEFHLLETSARVQAEGEVVWAEQSGKAGVHFVEITRFGRQRIKEWMMYNALSAREDCEAVEGWSLRRHPRLTAPEATTAAMSAAGLITAGPQAADFVCELPPSTALPELRKLLANRLEVAPRSGANVLLATLLFSTLVLQISPMPMNWALALMLGLAAPVSFWWLYRLAKELAGGE